MPVGQMPVEGLWIRTPDISTKAGLLESMVSRMSGPPPETTHYRIS